MTNPEKAILELADNFTRFCASVDRRQTALLARVKACEKKVDRLYSDMEGQLASLSMLIAQVKEMNESRKELMRLLEGMRGES